MKARLRVITLLALATLPMMLLSRQYALNLQNTCAKYFVRTPLGTFQVSIDGMNLIASNRPNQSQDPPATTTIRQQGPGLGSTSMLGPGPLNSTPGTVMPDLGHSDVIAPDPGHSDVAALDTRHCNITTPDPGHGNIAAPDPGHSDVTAPDFGHSDIIAPNFGLGHVVTPGFEHSDIITAPNSGLDRRQTNVVTQESGLSNVTTPDSLQPPTVPSVVAPGSSIECTAPAAPSLSPFTDGFAASHLPLGSPLSTATPDLEAPMLPDPLPVPAVEAPNEMLDCMFLQLIPSPHH